MVCVLAIVFGSLVTAGPETEQGGESWPHGAIVSGQPAFEKLREIHDAAIVALPVASPEDRPNIVRVLKAAFVCAAYDGSAPVGDPPPTVLPAHGAPHYGARTKVQAAWAALRMPPDETHPEEWPNWSLCAESLEHGHDE